MPDFRSSLTTPRPLLLLGTLALIEDHWVLSSVAGSSELPSGEEAAGLTKRKTKRSPAGDGGRVERKRRKEKGEDGMIRDCSTGETASKDAQWRSVNGSRRTWSSARV